MEGFLFLAFVIVLFYGILLSKAEKTKQQNRKEQAETKALLKEQMNLDKLLIEMKEEEQKYLTGDTIENVLSYLLECGILTQHEYNDIRIKARPYMK